MYKLVIIKYNYIYKIYRELINLLYFIVGRLLVKLLAN